jgi:hypothetical protein
MVPTQTSGAQACSDVEVPLADRVKSPQRRNKGNWLKGGLALVIIHDAEIFDEVVQEGLEVFRRALLTTVLCQLR